MMLDTSDRRTFGPGRHFSMFVVEGENRLE
jgi:hypothetical protein